MDALPSSLGRDRSKFGRKSRENSKKLSFPTASSELGDDGSSLSSASDHNKCISCKDAESTIKFVRCVECKRPWHKPCWPSGASPVCLREKCKIRAENRQAMAKGFTAQQQTGLSNSTSFPSKSAPSIPSNSPELQVGPSCDVLNCRNAPLIERVTGMVLCKLHLMSKRHEQASGLVSKTRTEVVRKPINAAKAHPALRPEDRQLLNKVTRSHQPKSASTSDAARMSNHAQKRGETMVYTPNFHQSRLQSSLLQREEGFGGANTQSTRSLASPISPSSAHRTSAVRINNVEKSASFVSYPDNASIMSKDTTNDNTPVSHYGPPGRAENTGAQMEKEMSPTCDTPTLPISTSASKTCQAPYMSNVKSGSDLTPLSVGAETCSRLLSNLGVATEVTPASTASSVSDYRSRPTTPAHEPKSLTSNGIRKAAKDIDNPTGMTSSLKRRKITTDHDGNSLIVDVNNESQEPTIIAKHSSLQYPAFSAAPMAAPAKSNTPSIDRRTPKLTAALTTSANTKGLDLNRSTPKLLVPSATSHLENPIKLDPPPSTFPPKIPNTSSPSRSPSPKRNETSLTGLVLGSEDHAYLPDLAESLHHFRQAAVEGNEMDLMIMQYQPNEDPNYEPTDCELSSSQNWGHINPRETWPPPKPSPDWFASTRAEIIARNKVASKSARRKKNFGVVLTEETKAERRAKGWNIHQEREVDTEGRRECARRLEEWTGLKVGNFEPGVVGGKLVMRENKETRTADGTRVKSKDELRVLAAE